ISSSSRTVPGRTARSSGSTAPCRPSGPTATSSPATKPAATPLHPGYTPTTLNAATAHSAASRPSAECHQPDGRVQLAALALGVDLADDGPGGDVLPHGRLDGAHAAG